MKLVERNYPDTHSRDLSPAQSSLLKAKELPRPKETIRQNILASFYFKYWIQCDCREPGPIMAIRHNAGGSFSLVTIASHGSHSTKCPYYTEPSLAQQSHTELQAPQYTFNFHREIKQTSNPRQSTTSTSSSVRQNTFYRLLATLLAKSGLTNLDSAPGFATCQARIEEAAKGLKLADKPLSDHLFFGIEKFRQVRDHISSQGPWKGARPHALLMDVVDEVERCGDDFHLVKYFSKERTTKFTLYKSVSKVLLHSGRMSLKKGPFIFLATIAETTTESGGSIIAPLRCYIAPVLSKGNWAIMDSDYERRVANRLISSKEWYSANADFLAAVSKPLFYTTTDIEPCLPDFMISSEHHSVILEVMGSHAPQYLDRKERTHASMEQLGQLITFDAYAADKGRTFDEKCFETVRKIFNTLKYKESS